MKIANSRPIAILMATYNGERFIAEQIDSILSQTNRDWTLYIQDDGSNDTTETIIDEYCSIHDNIKRVDLGLTRQGACLNFMTLLNIVESRYYMFCDQDDVWLSNKIEVTLAKMQEVELTDSDKPIIIHTDVKVVDKDLNIISHSKFNRRSISPEKLHNFLNKAVEYNFLMISMMVQGCTMMFNKIAKDLSYSYLNIRVHDSNISLNVARNSGRIVAVTQATMLYRLHSTNTCGMRSDSILSKVSNLRFILSENMKGFYIWKLYGGGSFIKWLYYRLRYLYLYRFYR